MTMMTIELSSKESRFFTNLWCHHMEVHILSIFDSLVYLLVSAEFIQCQNKEHPLNHYQVLCCFVFRPKQSSLFVYHAFYLRIISLTKFKNEKKPVNRI